MKELNYGTIGTIVGRYYAMDRDKRWDRVKIAVDGLVKGEGEATEDPVKLVEKKYEEDPRGDEFLKPIIIGGEKTRIKEDDTIFCFNYRSDRMREISSVLGMDPKPMEVEVPKNLVSLFLLLRNLCQIHETDLVYTSSLSVFTSSRVVQRI